MPKLRGPIWKRYNSVERPRALLDWLSRHRNAHTHEDHIGPLFWALTREWWSSFDRIDHRRFAAVFYGLRSYWEPQPEWHRLPERFTIWRGHDKSCVHLGLSWTRDRAVAESFAVGHRLIFNPTPTILEAEIARQDVALVFDNRKESEVVLFEPVGAGWRSTALASPTPSTILMG